MDSKIDFFKDEEALSAVCFVKYYLCSMMTHLSLVLKDLQGVAKKKKEPRFLKLK